MRRDWIAIATAAALLNPAFVQAQQQQQPAPAAQPAADAPPPATKLPADQLDSLVAPVALYPDPLLAQVLVAATYPLEIVQLQQWLAKNTGLKDKALADAVKKQNWDPSIQAMAPMPDVVKRLADDIKWTTDLGNAFLAQQSEVMDAVQRMRKKAHDNGNLKTTPEQKVETRVVENKQVIVVEQANPQVVYVPTYNPVVVYGPPVYPYPPIYYPPPGYYAAGLAISFGVGMAMGAAWGGGWCCGASWGGNDIDINIDNDFNRNSNRNVNRDRTTNRAAGRGSNKWQHNPQHRGAAPYSDRATSDRFGGSNRTNAANRPTTASTSQALSNRAQSGSRPSTGAANRSAGGASPARTGGDRVGNRSVSNSSSANRGAFGGASSGVGSSGARAASSRGSTSMRSSGVSRGGGGGRRR